MNIIENEIVADALHYMRDSDAFMDVLYKLARRDLVKDSEIALAVRLMVDISIDEIELDMLDPGDELREWISSDERARGEYLIK